MSENEMSEEDRNLILKRSRWLRGNMATAIPILEWATIDIQRKEAKHFQTRVYRGAQFRTPCPHCGERFEIDFQWTIPSIFRLEPSDPSKVSLQCPNCKKEIEEKDREAMVREGRWETVTDNGSIIYVESSSKEASNVSKRLILPLIQDEVAIVTDPRPSPSFKQFTDYLLRDMIAKQRMILRDGDLGAWIDDLDDEDPEPVRGFFGRMIDRLKEFFAHWLKPKKPQPNPMFGIREYLAPDPENPFEFTDRPISEHPLFSHYDVNGDPVLWGSGAELPDNLKTKLP